MNNYEKEQINEALEVLGLKPNFTYQELHNKKRVLLAKNHPDRHQGEEEKYNKISERINEAFYVLKKKLDETNKKEEELKANEFKKNFIKDLNNILNKYKDYKTVEKLCNVYLERIKNLKTLEELKLQKNEFNTRFKVLKESIAFDNEKNNFVYKLNNIRNNPDIYIEEKKLAILYLEKLENIYNMDELKEIIKEYQDKVNELREDIKKRHLIELKNDFEIELSKLSKVGFDKDILDVINEYLEKIKNIENLNELIRLREEFNIKIDKIQKYKAHVKQIKKSLLINIKNEIKKHHSKEHDKLFEKYQLIIEEADVLEELDIIREEFKKEFEKTNQLEKEKYEYFIVLKDKVKRACIYNFYKASVNHNAKRILSSLEILKDVLTILEIAEMDNFNIIIDILENINYKNLELDKSKLSFFILTKESKILLKDKENLYKILKSEDVEEIDDDSIEEFVERKYIIDKILKDQYNYATNNDIEKIRMSIEMLKKVFKRLDEMNDLEIINNYSIYERVDFKDINTTKKAIKDLSFSNNIYLRLKTGDICLLEEIDDNILVTPLSINKGISIISKDRKEKEFITAREFFENAYFTNGKKVCERINRYDTSRILYTFERKPLYFYRSLLLNFYEPTYFNPNGYFEFTASSSAFGFRLEETKLDMGDCYKYRNRELCEEQFIEYVKKQIEYAKEHEEKIDF